MIRKKVDATRATSSRLPPALARDSKVSEVERRLSALQDAAAARRSQLVVLQVFARGRWILKGMFGIAQRAGAGGAWKSAVPIPRPCRRLGTLPHRRLRPLFCVSREHLDPVGPPCLCHPPCTACCNEHRQVLRIQVNRKVGLFHLSFIEKVGSQAEKGAAAALPRSSGHCLSRGLF